ncbi:MAG: hypothetical protein E6G04_11945 [Actinobacteria bacterium]|nr:MAG: hypothetical protein E6G04_11945 [Actinomycetota bacterium]
MLFLHETHRVAGERADEFEASWRGRLDQIAKGDDARLLWFFHVAHGTGLSYVVVTIIALRDGASFERHLQRLETGDLHDWYRELESIRHDASSKVLAPVSWSVLQEIELGSLPTDGFEKPLALYMEDTVLPRTGRLDDYLQAASTLYARDTIGKRMAEGTSLLDLRACFRTIAGAHAGREVILWQRVERPELLQPLLTREVPTERRGPGTWMNDALEFRDQWESRLLRTVAWSPLD